MKFILIFSLALILSGCQKVEFDRVVTQYLKTKVEVIEISYPRNFKIHIKSLDGSVKSILRSPRCVYSKNIDLGSVYELEYYRVIKYKGNEVVSSEYNFPSACTFAKYARIVKYSDLRY